MSYRDLKISFKFILMVTIVYFCSFGALVYITYNQTMTVANEDAEVIADQYGRHYQKYIKAMFERAIWENIAVRDAIQTIINNEEEPSRELITTIMVNWFESNPGLVDTWLRFEDNAMDNRDEEFKDSERYGASGNYSAWICDDGTGNPIVYPSELSGDPVADDWYHNPKRRGITTLSDPYLFEYATGIKRIVTISESVLDNRGNFLGLVGCDFEVGTIDSIIDEISVYDSGFLMLFSENGTVIVSRDDSWLGENVGELEVLEDNLIQKILNGRDFSLSTTFPGVDGKMDVVGVPITFAESGQSWMLTVNIPHKEIVEKASSKAIMTVILALIAFIVTIVVAYRFSRSLTKPLEYAVSMAQVISKGDLRQDISSDSRDELGQLLDAISKMKQNIADTVSVVSSGSEQIVAASSQLSQGNQDLAIRTEDQATALEETSTAIEEMNSSIRSNAQNTEVANKLSTDVSTKADKGTEAVNQMITSMNRISDSSNQISAIIEVINNIAFQTNLLALNASIEAARAGEQGKGFAVVAVEVRKLAKRSDKAASEIAQIIKSSNIEVTEGVEIANNAGEMLNEITNAVQKMTNLIGEISTASQQQLSSVDQIDKTLSTLDDNTQKNASLVEEAAAATEELSAQAVELNRNVKFFKLNDDFKSESYEQFTSSSDRALELYDDDFD